MSEYTRYLGEVLQQIFIVFHILKLISQLLGCIQIFQGLNEDMLDDYIMGSFEVLCMV